MSAYFQMGHNTENLVGEPDLEEFRGIILSPVNRSSAEIQRYMPQFRVQGDYDIILDPQLYYTRGERGYLTDQPYFPDSFDTLDFSDPQGWSGVIEDLASYAMDLEVDALASPVSMPRRWTDGFYNTCVETSRMLSQTLSSEARVLTTCIVSLSDLADGNRARQIASIMTRHNTDGFYLVLETETEPRRELADSVGLSMFMLLISLFEQHAPVTVAFSSSDMILFKSAGATNCGTCKFFNLRRFTLSRFEEPPPAGGGQLPYWLEHNLLAFIREADIRRLQRDGYDSLIGGLHSGSHSGLDILEFLDNYPGEAWLAKSWRQYLSWFGKTEQEVAIGGLSVVSEWLKQAEDNWLALNDDGFLFDDPRNDGGWIRPWRQALRDFGRF